MIAYVCASFCVLYVSLYVCTVQQRNKQTPACNPVFVQTWGFPNTLWLRYCILDVYCLCSHKISVLSLIPAVKWKHLKSVMWLCHCLYTSIMVRQIGFKPFPIDQFLTQCEREKKCLSSTVHFEVSCANDKAEGPYVYVSYKIWEIFNSIGNLFCGQTIREDRKVSFLLEQTQKKGTYRNSLSILPVPIIFVSLVGFRSLTNRANCVRLWYRFLACQTARFCYAD